MLKMVRGLRNLTEPPHNPILTLGNFDGVHIGHSVVIKRAVELAAEHNGTSVVYTFDPHPIKILQPEHKFELLTSFKKKVELIDELGVDILICADFNKRFARVHPGDFTKMLKDALNMSVVVVGHDYSFGQGKAGGVDSLRRLGSNFSFDVEAIEPVLSGDKRVSSSLIRILLGEGKVAEASSLLGRHYSLSGRVVDGVKRGKKIGFPTANIEAPYEMLPLNGVYAAFVNIEGNVRQDAVVNIGYNPTFERNKLVVEAHVFGLEDDIYGLEVEIFFLERLRAEHKFETESDLVVQLQADSKQAKEILRKYK